MKKNIYISKRSEEIGKKSNITIRIDDKVKQSQFNRKNDIVLMCKSLKYIVAHDCAKRTNGLTN